VAAMKQVLVLGAGQSSAFLISHLLELASQQGWFVTVGDLDTELAEARVGEHLHGSALHFDVNDANLRSTQIENADVVVNMLPPAYQDLIAWDCVNHGRHMLSVSYRDQAVRDLGPDALRKGVLLLCELGLDPGIDHMSAMALIRRVHERGGTIRGFRSYGSGIPAPDQEHNPLRYVVTWNPRNVAMSGEAGAQYMEHGRITTTSIPPDFPSCTASRSALSLVS
jgi:saccharopine dehydrogenase-like NADP-dependent oxidoreductase